MRLFKTFRSMGRKLFGGSPTYDGVGGGRRALAWSVGNPGAVAALLFTQHELRAKSRDLVRRLVQSQFVEFVVHRLPSAP